MSMPPQGGWQPPGPVPPNQGPPYPGPVGPGSQQPYLGQQPPGYPQAPWPQQGVPPQKGNSLKWLLVAIAVLLVIGVTIGATLLFTRGDGDAPSTPSTSPLPGDIASANDTGPVSIITDEPTCQAYIALNNSIANVEANGWAAQRSTLGPAPEWSSDQRSQVQAVATAMRNAADQSVPLAKQTPHRVMRELYEQFIAYGRAYADSVPNYTPADNGLASTNVSAGNALASICNAITYGSATRSVAVEPAPAPTQIANPGNPADPRRFITSPDSTCTAWIQRSDRFNADTAEWEKLDSSVPASQWTPERRAIEQSVQPLLTAYANGIQAAGQQSSNPVLEDFALTAALYIRAYGTVGDSYTNADGWLSAAGFRITNAVSGACRAVGG